MKVGNLDSALVVFVRQNSLNRYFKTLFLFISQPLNIYSPEFKTFGEFHVVFKIEQELIGSN